MKARISSIATALIFALAAPRVTLSELVSIRVNGADGRPLPCRIHIVDSTGKPQKPDDLPSWNDHFVCDGGATVQLELGEYSWVIERGPEYEQASGKLLVSADAANKVDATLNRISTLRDDGWYSGDLHVHRKVEAIEMLMKAEDLDFAPVITWWNARKSDVPRADQVLFRFDGHRLYETLAGEDEREGGALLYFGLKRSLDLAAKSREFPSPMTFVRQAHEHDKDVWIDIEKPFWWDVPTWLASAEMDSIGLANNHMCRSRMYESEAWGRPRDATRLPAPRGNGFWTQEIYYHILNTGIRMPPSAGSASGVLPNPVGYNRVYVHLTEPFSRVAWFAALRRGNSFVTNGPLLRVRANQKLSGSTVQMSLGEPLTVQLDVKLTSRDRVKELEIIHNGRVAKNVPCSADVSQQKTVQLTIKEPGWFLVRAIADVDHTFRFASTAPWYIESESVPRRISKRSSQFFFDWVEERMERVRKNVQDEAQLMSVLEAHQRAQRFWLDRVNSANAD